MTRKTYVETLPPILILHLKRFVYDGAHGTRKVWKKIAYPGLLEVPVDVLSPGQRPDTRPPQYQLFGGTSKPLCLVLMLFSDISSWDVGDGWTLHG